MAEYKVIFHINEEDKWETVLSNATNLWNDLGKDMLEIIILVNGKAVQSYIKENERLKNKKVESLLENNVRFQACHNALRGNDLTESDIHSFVEVVPAGVSELVKRQHEGYAYIKP